MKDERKALKAKRERLRRKLQRHFSIPVMERDYAEVERIVDQLDEVRQRLYELEVAKHKHPAETAQRVAEQRHAEAVASHIG